MSRVFVIAGEPAVSSYIRVQDGGKLARQTVSHDEVPFLELGNRENTIAGAEGWRANGSNEGMSGRSKLDFHLS